MNKLFVQCEEIAILCSFFSDFSKKFFNFLLTYRDLCGTIQTSVKLEYVEQWFSRGGSAPIIKIGDAKSVVAGERFADPASYSTRSGLAIWCDFGKAVSNGRPRDRRVYLRETIQKK